MSTIDFEEVKALLRSMEAKSPSKAKKKAKAEKTAKAEVKSKVESFNDFVSRNIQAVNQKWFYGLVSIRNGDGISAVAVADMLVLEAVYSGRGAVPLDGISEKVKCQWALDGVVIRNTNDDYGFIESGSEGRIITAICCRAVARLQYGFTARETVELADERLWEEDAVAEYIADEPLSFGEQLLLVEVQEALDEMTVAQRKRRLKEIQLSSWDTIHGAFLGVWEDAVAGGDRRTLKEARTALRRALRMTEAKDTARAVADAAAVVKYGSRERARLIAEVSEAEEQLKAIGFL